MMDNHVAIRMLLILAATIVLFAIVAMYSRKKDQTNRAGFREQQSQLQYKKRMGRGTERFDEYASATGTDSLRPQALDGHHEIPSASSSASLSGFGGDSAAAYPSSINQSDSIAMSQMKVQRKEFNREVSSLSREANAAERKSSCYPKDELVPEDLIPKDSADSRWARMNPTGQGDIQDQNFLTAGYNMGIDTQSSSLRNSNLGLRSEPPNPQIQVSPWQMSTIQPDTNRRPLEIQGDY